MILFSIIVVLGLLSALFSFLGSGGDNVNSRAMAAFFFGVPAWIFGGLAVLLWVIRVTIASFFQ